jgi:hypothetical protein
VIEHKGGVARGSLADDDAVLVLHASPLFLARSRVSHAPKLVHPDGRGDGPVPLPRDDGAV